MGERGVVVGVGDDMMEGMQCSEHPYRNNPGGICALCLQERLGKLVSSSKSNNPFFTLPTDHRTAAASAASTASPSASPPSALGSTSRAAAKIPFLSSSIIHHKKKNRSVAAAAASTAAAPSSSILKRSKSVAPKPIGEIGSVTATTYSPRMKKSLWSYFYLSSFSTSAAYASKRRSANSTVRSGGATACNGQQHPPSVESCSSSVATEPAAEELPTPASSTEAAGAVASPGGSVSSSSFGRKVARSRSVGCGSRSFSGDFLERISTGFGDCSTLRRVESQRESKPKPKMSFSNADGGDGGVEQQQRVKYCGGLFGGFGMMSSSSSSSYWLSTATTDHHHHQHHHHRMSTSAAGSGGGRSRSWVWGSFASPMRAFRPTSYSSVVASKPYTITAAAANTANAKLGGSSLNPSSLTVGC